MNMSTFSLELWQVILLVISITGTMWGLARSMLAVQLSHIDGRLVQQDATRESNHKSMVSRLEGVEQINREESAQWQRVERELMGLKAELPLSYVRREDYIRGQSVLEAKLDGLATKIENAQLRSSFQQSHPGVPR
jgi:hypothetical protein